MVVSKIYKTKGAKVLTFKNRNSRHLDRFLLSLLFLMQIFYFNSPSNEERNVTVSEVFEYISLLLMLINLESQAEVRIFMSVVLYNLLNNLKRV